MFRAIFSLIIRSIWTVLQLLVLHTYVVAGWYHGNVGKEAVIQFRCSWCWAKISLETCRATKEWSVILHRCVLLAIFIYYIMMHGNMNITFYSTEHYFILPSSVAARSKALVYGRLFAGTAGSNPTGSMNDPNSNASDLTYTCEIIWISVMTPTML